MRDVEDVAAVTVAAMNIRRYAVLAYDVKLRLADASTPRLASEADAVGRVAAS